MKSVRHMSTKQISANSASVLDAIACNKAVSKIVDTVGAAIETLSPQLSRRNRSVSPKIRSHETTDEIPATRTIGAQKEDLELSVNITTSDKAPTTECKAEINASFDPSVSGEGSLINTDVSTTNLQESPDKAETNTLYSSYFAPVIDRFYKKAPKLHKEHSSLVTLPKPLPETSIGKHFEEFESAMLEAAKVLEGRESLDSSSEAAGMEVKAECAKFLSKVVIDSRTRALCTTFKSAKQLSSKVKRLENLCQHLREYPESRHTAIKERIMSVVEQTRSISRDKRLLDACGEALALLGFVPPVKGQGVRILAIDGGGTRGVICIEILRQLEKKTGQRIPDLFDYVIGTSTGALVAILLCAYRVSIDECERLYELLSAEVFAKNRILGTGRLVWNHAYYDASTLERIYRDNMGEKFLIESARDAKCPKMAIVSTSVNQPRLSAYLFRNYNFPVHTQSRYLGSSDYKIWQTLKASCAAPGYFEDCKLGDQILQDGGVLTNNPTAVGIHECKLLWPAEHLQCVVSVGNGRYEASDAQSAISLKDKLTKIVDSATDTEGTHTVLQDLLPPATYFRFNPYMSENIALDEMSTEKLELLQEDARTYLCQNEGKLQQVASQLTQTKSVPKQCFDWIKTNKHKCSSLPFYS